MKTCPNCNKTYKPKLERKHPEMLIQEEFPDATPAEREQCITGLFSDKFWTVFLGGAQ